jgi:hypothetical protein
MHEEHVHMLAELKEDNAARMRNIEEVNRSILQESKRSDERAQGIERKIEKVADDLIQAQSITEKLDRENHARLDITRRELSSELATAGSKLSLNLQSVKMEMEHGDKKLELAISKASMSLTDQLHRSSNELSEKQQRAARDADAHFHSLGERMDAEAARAAERTEQAAAHAHDELAELRSLSQLRFKQLDSDLRSNVEVLKATIRSVIGPELKDMVQREAFDLTQRMLSDHYQSVRVLLDSKVDFAVAGEILKKKADAMELGAFARKSDVGAMIAAALAAARPAATPRLPDGDPARAGLDRARLDQLETENIRLVRCVDDLYHMVKSDRRARAADGEVRPSHTASGLGKALLAKSLDLRDPAGGQPAPKQAKTALRMAPRPPAAPFAAQPASPRTAGWQDSGPRPGASASHRSPRVFVRRRGQQGMTAEGRAGDARGEGDADVADVVGAGRESGQWVADMECGADIISLYRAGAAADPAAAPALPPLPGGGGSSAGGGAAEYQPRTTAPVPVESGTGTKGVGADSAASGGKEGALTPARLLLLPVAGGLRRGQAAASPRLWFK